MMLDTALCLLLLAQTPDKPESWGKGARLQSVGTTGINAYRSYVKGSLTIRKTPDGPLLKEAADYLVSPEFAMVGLGSSPSISADDTVCASYQFSLLRIDTVVVDGRGMAKLVRGKPDIAIPLAPEVLPGTTRLLNVFRDYGARTVTNDDLFPILDAPVDCVTHTTSGRIPKTLDKLRAGMPVTIVCWGDSVTCGGDVSRGSQKYVEQFRTMLLDRFSYAAPINIINISVGGTNSSMWLRREPYNDAFFAQNPMWPKDQTDFERIVSLKPDLVTIEFVNDGGLDTAGVETVYSDIMGRLAAFKTEFILITPHFTSLDMMGNKSLRDADGRKYVEGLRAFADKHNVALADASSRWAHLWREGVPYVTLLANCLNHPDDRGHRLFAEELIRCFDTP
ncbi:MAG: SGNH/GDSL hydrolase family protein [Candidatus Hydrogenedentes bacterium]|nr:SGNH/GDSL hydrolase family protein [Candidatus Hydrogenedentota bacterium]